MQIRRKEVSPVIIIQEVLKNLRILEKVVIVKVPAKCACGSIEVKPKIVKAPEFKELPYESKVVKEEFVKESIYGKEGYGKEGYGYGKLY